MASPFQQQSLRRKLVYTVLIIALFCVTLALRTSQSFGIDAQANTLGVKEESLGEVELMGSLVRRALTGSRGFAVCSLWANAIEKQKRHEWNELELRVNSLTKLQPHFITPWLFQSWNLAYNVSVESDRVLDKYFYITRGIELLGEGERQNRDHPDLRFSIGFYNQHKIGLSDENNTARCLYHLSCIDPLERDPDRFRRDENGNLVANFVNLEKFEEFCKKYPTLVRRLREALKRETPSDVVDFLAENRKVPSRYEEPTTTPSGERQALLKPPERRFPLLPPLGREDEGEPADPDGPEPIARICDNFMVARDWYTYSCKPLPPPNQDFSDPVLDDPVTGKHYRKPRYMAMHIFRGYPARGQTYVAERLEHTEGWFGPEGWKITGWFPDDKFPSGEEAVVGKDTPWATRMWEKAYTLWKRDGEENGLYLEPEAIARLQAQARKYMKTYGVAEADYPRALTSTDEQNPEMRDSYKAFSQLHWYEHYRSMTNFPHFYFRSQVEQAKDTVDARRDFFLADQLRKSADPDQAIDKYRAAMKQWRAILLAHKDFRRDSLIQEETYEAVIKYIEMVRDRLGPSLKKVLVIYDYVTQAAVQAQVAFQTPFQISFPVLLWPHSIFAVRELPPPVETPLDGTDEDGFPLLSEESIQRVRARLGLATERPGPASTGPLTPAVPNPPGVAPAPEKP
jgi:hypothetical protein